MTSGGHGATGGLGNGSQNGGETSGHDTPSMRGCYAMGLNQPSTQRRLFRGTIVTNAARSASARGNGGFDVTVEES